MASKVVVLLAACVALSPAVGAQTPSAGGDITPVHVRENIWMLVTPDGNLAMQVGDEGVLLVDTGRAGTGDAVLQAIRQVTPLPIRYIINTSAGPNQIGNNVEFGRLAGGGTDRKGRGPTTAIVANEAVLTRMSAPDANGGQGYSSAGWPTDPYALQERTFRYNHEAVEIIHVPNGYSDGDSLVYFRRSDVVVAGEIYSTKRFPLVDRAHGGSVKGVLAGLNRILDITVPEVVADNFAEGGTLVIPATGRISDEDDVVEYRDMVAITRDRMASLVKMGQSLAQAKAANPLVDYALRYSIPSWTGTMYIDAMFAEMSGAGASK